MIRGLLLFAVSALAAGAIYAPVLGAPFLADDFPLVAHNPWLHPLTGAGLRELLDPFGPLTRATGNWAPAHLLGHALALELFGTGVRGHHVVNLLLHALNATLLLALLRAHGVPAAAAGFGAAFFLVHPANVEAVAWISQLKSVLALAFGLSALLLAPRRPLAGLLLFTLATLTKPLAIGFLAFEAVRAALRAREGDRGALPWLIPWAIVALATSAAAFAAFGRVGAFRAEQALAGLEQARWMLFLLGRYAALAVTSWGSSVFAQPAAPRSALDPWVLLGLLALCAGGARALAALARGRSEAAFWAFAAAGWLPISQLFPFRYPIADRYLYFVLPGLIGAALLALHGPAHAVLRDHRGRQAAAIAVAALMLAGLALRARERTLPWTSGPALLADAARRHPDGTQAQLLRASQAARQGDADAALAALRRARASGFDDPLTLAQDPTFAALRSDARFKALVQDLAAEHVERLRAFPDPSQLELQQLGALHVLREEWSAAAAAFERALATDGPGDDATLRRQLALARGEQARAAPAAPPE